MDLEEDVLRVAMHLAEAREESLGRILSQLIRLGLQPAHAAATRQHGIPTLTRKPGARPVTSQTVKDLLESGV